MKAILAAGILALASGGCVASSTVTDADRQVNHQIIGAAKLIEARLGGIDGIGIVVTQAIKDIIANAEHLESVHGAPENPLPYTKENSDDSRQKSAEEHSGGGIWGWITGGLATAAALGWAILKSTQLGRVIDTFVTAGMNVRDKVKAGTVTEKDVKDLYEKANDALPPSARKKVEETVTRVKRKVAGVIPEALHTSVNS